jgi:hypothetical protein
MLVRMCGLETGGTCHFVMYSNLTGTALVQLAQSMRRSAKQSLVKVFVESKTTLFLNKVSLYPVYS